ncbi:hypothetical protein [Streptomyces sp. NPDC050255]|uniref:hypothetical protein n=1 Tax=Streptomyces sp. NPDC050255 TaxID=3365606 RepID=UPI0037BBAA3E
MKTTDQYAVDTDMDGVLFTARLATVGVLLLAALCAPRQTSERAFRLVDLMQGSPEPPPPAPAPSARRRAQPGGR